MRQFHRDSDLSRLPGLLRLVVACFIANGYGTKSAQTVPSLAVPVTVAKALQKTMPIGLTAIGSIEAYSTVSIKAQVNANSSKFILCREILSGRAICSSLSMRGRSKQL